MDPNLVWLIAGFALVIAELVTGTFYLLVLGIAGFAGAAAAYFGLGLPLQALVAAAVAIAGAVWVQRYRAGAASAPMPSLDIGQPALFDSWVDRASGQARVKHRDALWDAHISGGADGERGEVLYVTAVEGSTLQVSKTRPGA